MTERMHTRESLAPLIELLGDDRVVLRADVLDWQQKTLLPNGGKRPSVVLRPRGPDDVEAIFRLANTHDWKLYVISRGMNLGWGAAAAPIDGAMLVDLSDMSRILDFDDTLGTVRLEPGVSQGALERYVTAQSDRWFPDCTSAGENASVVGNILERGLGHSANGERFNTVSHFDVVLPNGQRIQTGFGNIPGSRLSDAWRHGLGPSVDGLFSQSTLGVVVALTLELTPRPSKVARMGFRFPEARIADAIDALRPLRLNGLLRENVHLYPVEPTRSDWVAVANLGGTLAQILADYQVLRRALRGIGKTYITYNVRRRLTSMSRWLSELGIEAASWVEDTLGQSHDVARGRPHGAHDFLTLTARGSGVEIDQADARDPRDHHLGLVFITPAVPMRGTDVEEALARSRELVEKHGFGLRTSINLVNGRSVVLVTKVPFDARDDDARARADRCYRELFSWTWKRGFTPYRIGADPACPDVEDADWSLARALKKTLDPKGVLVGQVHLPWNRSGPT